MGPPMYYIGIDGKQEISNGIIELGCCSIFISYAVQKHLYNCLLFAVYVSVRGILYKI